MMSQFSFSDGRPNGLEFQDLTLRIGKYVEQKIDSLMTQE